MATDTKQTVLLTDVQSLDLVSNQPSNLRSFFGLFGNWTTKLFLLNQTKQKIFKQPISNQTKLIPAYGSPPTGKGRGVEEEIAPLLRRWCPSRSLPRSTFLGTASFPPSVLYYLSDNLAVPFLNESVLSFVPAAPRTTQV